MVDTGELESFLSEKTAKGGDIVEIIGEGEIQRDVETQFGKRNILNIPVKINGRQLIWSPGKVARKEAEKIFNSKDTKNWINRKFQVTLVKMPVKGELKDILVPGSLEPLKG